VYALYPMVGSVGTADRKLEPDAGNVRR